MINWIDAIYLLFSGLVIYFTFIFLFLFFGNRKNLYKVPKISRWPRVSIIVPAHNESETIGEVVANLRNLKYPRPVEIIVVDDGSNDRTAATAKAAGANVIRVRHGGKAKALNIGIRAARGDIVASVDADSWPAKDALINSVPYFSEEEVAAVTTRIFVKERKKFLDKLQSIEYAMIAWSRKLFEYIDGVYVTPGPLSLYRRKLLLKIGGFDETNLTEDIEVAWHLLDKGYKIRMSTGKTLTNTPKNFGSWWRQRLRWNVGGIQTSLKYKSSVFKKGSKSFGFFVLPFFMLSYVLTLLALSLFTYLIYLWIFNNVTFFFSAYNAGLDPIKHSAPFWLPDMFTIFGVLVFAFSILVVNLGLKDMGHPRGASTWIYILLYLSIYITIFPFILVHSIIKYLQGHRHW